MTQHKVEGHSGLYKDDESGVIVNKSSSERDRYRLAKEQALKNLESQNEIENLRGELDEIKVLLKQLQNNVISS